MIVDIKDIPELWANDKLLERNEFLVIPGQAGSYQDFFIDK